jgi:phosphate transport system protein
MIGRYYERIGDHAVNIGERVMYMVTGWLPEHSGSARHRLRGLGAEDDAGPDAAGGPVGGPANGGGV